MWSDELSEFAGDGSSARVEDGDQAAEQSGHDVHHSEDHMERFECRKNPIHAMKPHEWGTRLIITVLPGRHHFVGYIASCGAPDGRKGKKGFSVDLQTAGDSWRCRPGALPQASGGSRLQRDGAGCENGFVEGLVFGRLLDVVDDQGVDGDLDGYEAQTEGVEVPLREQIGGDDAT
jgi:hypothetical protein